MKSEPNTVCINASRLNSTTSLSLPDTLLKNSPSMSAKASGKGLDSRGFKLFKTEKCMFFFNGACERGDYCTFAHDDNEIRPRPDMTKTRICPHMKNGTCNKGNLCTYAHCELELRDRIHQIGMHKNNLTGNNKNKNLSEVFPTNSSLDTTNVLQAKKFIPPPPLENKTMPIPPPPPFSKGKIGIPPPPDVAVSCYWRSLSEANCTLLSDRDMQHDTMRSNSIGYLREDESIRTPSMDSPSPISVEWGSEAIDLAADNPTVAVSADLQLTSQNFRKNGLKNISHHSDYESGTLCGDILDIEIEDGSATQIMKQYYPILDHVELCERQLEEHTKNSSAMSYNGHINNEKGPCYNANFFTLPNNDNMQRYVFNESAFRGNHRTTLSANGDIDMLRPHRMDICRNPSSLERIQMLHAFFISVQAEFQYLKSHMPLSYEE